jgi:hypothetical protein
MSEDLTIPRTVMCGVTEAGEIKPFRVSLENLGGMSSPAELSSIKSSLAALKSSTYQTPQAGVLLGSGDTLLFTATANCIVTVIICNVNSAAVTFQLSHGTLNDTNSLYKNWPLQLGTNTSFALSMASGEVLRGLCSTNNGATSRVYVGVV